jgi:hypothetical protein
MQHDTTRQPKTHDDTHMKFWFLLYPYLAPLLLAPLAWYLWQNSYQGNHRLVAMAWGLPVLWAYIVPAIGTNVLKVWEFDVRFRLGRFRPQHGFVFGSATAVLAWLVHGAPAQNLADCLRLALVLASVLGFWNLLYDIRVLELGILRVYNQPWAEGRCEAAVAMDYAPWFFAGFGAVYGMAIGLAECYAPLLDSWPRALLALTVALLLACAVPTAGYMARSWRRHGHAGTRPVARVAPPLHPGEEQC